MLWYCETLGFTFGNNAGLSLNQVQYVHNRLPVNNVRGCNMHQESLASTSVLSCRTGWLRGCFQNPGNSSNKINPCKFLKTVCGQSCEHCCVANTTQKPRKYCYSLLARKPACTPEVEINLHLRKFHGLFRPLCTSQSVAKSTQ